MEISDLIKERTRKIEVFPWSDKFKVGIDIIDNQHKKLVQLLNNLTVSLIENQDAVLNQLFDELTSYAEYHFKTEEELWHSHFGNDEWCTQHQETHSSFLPEINKLREQQKGVPLNEIMESIVKYLIRWLVFHIVESDMRMANVVYNLNGKMTLPEAKASADDQMSRSSKVLTDAIFQMYDALSTLTLDLMREHSERLQAEKKLQEAYRELEKLSVTDQMTELYNRRHFETVFEQELLRTRRAKRKLAFIMFDIDHFKKLNDRYGHLEGDKALKKVGEKLKALCRRPGDFAFRLGGEEFGIIVSDQNLDDIASFAESIRSEMYELHIPNTDSNVADYMTISIGMIIKQPDSEDTVDTFIKNADERLYKAKQQGRNQIVY